MLHSHISHILCRYTHGERAKTSETFNFSRLGCTQRHIKAIMFSRANCCFCEVHVFSMEFSFHPAARANTVFSASPTLQHFAQHFRFSTEGNSRQTLYVWSQCQASIWAKCPENPDKTHTITIKASPISTRCRPKSKDQSFFSGSFSSLFTLLKRARVCVCVGVEMRPTKENELRYNWINVVRWGPFFYSCSLAHLPWLFSTTESCSTSTALEPARKVCLYWRRKTCCREQCRLITGSSKLVFFSHAGEKIRAENWFFFKPPHQMCVCAQIFNNKMYDSLFRAIYFAFTQNALLWRRRRLCIICGPHLDKSELFADWWATYKFRVCEKHRVISQSMLVYLVLRQAKGWSGWSKSEYVCGQQ